MGIQGIEKRQIQGNRMGRSKYKDGIELYRLYYDAHPSSSRAAYNLGRACTEDGRNDLAIRYLKESLRLLPEDRSVSAFSRRFIQRSATRLLDDLT